MAFSGTISSTTFNTDKVITNAFRRCKLMPQSITSEMIDVAKDQLFLILSSLSNQGIQLWCIEKLLLPLYAGVATVTLPLGTIDILNSNFRTLTYVTGTDTDTSTTHKVEFADATAVTTVGVLWSAASVPLSLERSDDGVAWTVVQTETDPGATAGEVSWFDLESSVATTFFRVVAVTGTLGFDAIYLANNPSTIPLSRMNRDQYTNLPNRAFQNNRPLQFWYNRVIPRPEMIMWPVPDSGAAEALLEVWRQRHLMDVGTMTQEIEVPQRWYMAIVTWLAKELAREIPEVPVEVIPMLDTDASMALRLAQDEERDNSPVMIAPNISPYTA